MALSVKLYRVVGKAKDPALRCDRLRAAGAALQGRGHGSVLLAIRVEIRIRWHGFQISGRSHAAQAGDA